MVARPLGLTGRGSPHLMVSWKVVDDGPSAMRGQILPSCRNPLANLSGHATNNQPRRAKGGNTKPTHESREGRWLV